MIYVPYTLLAPEAVTALRGQRFDAVPMLDDKAYVRFFEERWAKGETFVVVEHDVVVWPGAIDAMLACSHEWCAYGYAVDHDLEHDSFCAFLGCAKISDGLIAALPRVWAEKSTRHWQDCDCHLTTYARARGFNVHMHRPHVENLGSGRFLRA